MTEQRRKFKKKKKKLRTILSSPDCLGSLMMQTSLKSKWVLGVPPPPHGAVSSLREDPCLVCCFNVFNCQNQVRCSVDTC